MTMAPIDADAQELDKIFFWDKWAWKQSIQEKKTKNIPCQLSMSQTMTWLFGMDQPLSE